MPNVHFIRHGFADWVEFGINGLRVDYRHMTGHIDIITIQPEHVILRNAMGDITHEYDHNVCSSAFIGRTVYRGDNPVDAAGEIETLIQEHTGHRVYIAREYVEAYMITNHPPLYACTTRDIQLFNGVRIHGLTVGDMLQRGALNWSTDMAGYKLDRIADLLAAQELLDMSFVDFYTLIHDNNYKTDYRERVVAILTTCAV